jgi:hypothetical protein
MKQPNPLKYFIRLVHLTEDRMFLLSPFRYMFGTNCDIQRKYMCRLCGKIHSSLTLNNVVHTGTIFLQSFDKILDLEA